jgi:predicted DNA-binding transcriptional regulator AlpA
MATVNNKKCQGGSPPKTSRNNRICKMREQGATYAEIANKFGISVPRAGQICRDNCKSMDFPDDLITLSECAQIAGVANSTITSWSTRFADFPRRYNPVPGQGSKSKNLREPEFRAWLKKHKKRSRPQAGVSRTHHRKRKMKVIIHPQPKNDLGSRIKRFLGVNS